MTADETIVQQQIVQASGNSLALQTSASVFRQRLAAYIHELINANFDKLVSMLYPLDVNEKKLKQLIQDKAAEDAGLTIADAIIERLMQKVESRRKYRMDATNIPDEEKW